MNLSPEARLTELVLSNKLHEGAIIFFRRRPELLVKFLLFFEDADHTPGPQSLRYFTRRLIIRSCAWYTQEAKKTYEDIEYAFAQPELNE